MFDSLFCDVHPRRHPARHPTEKKTVNRTFLASKLTESVVAGLPQRSGLPQFTQQCSAKACYSNPIEVADWTFVDSIKHGSKASAFSTGHQPNAHCATSRVRIHWNTIGDAAAQTPSSYSRRAPPRRRQCYVSAHVSCLSWQNAAVPYSIHETFEGNDISPTAVDRQIVAWVLRFRCQCMQWSRAEFPIQLVGLYRKTFRLAPPTLCSAPPTCVRFDRFLASKRSFSTAGSQNYRIRRHFCI